MRGLRLVADQGDVLRLKLALREVSQTVEYPEELLKDVANKAAYPAVAEIFDNEGYGAWAALTPAYALEKTAEFGELPILERTGDLRTSLTLSSGPESVNQFASDGSLAIGSAVPYFGIVNSIRPIAQFTDEHLENMRIAVTEHIGEVAVAEGFEVFES